MLVDSVSLWLHISLLFFMDLIYNLQEPAGVRLLGSLLFLKERERERETWFKMIVLHTCYFPTVHS